MIRRWTRALIPFVTFLTLMAIAACGSTEPADETASAPQESSSSSEGGGTSLPTETSGSEGTSPTTPGIEWPSELTGLVPQPEGCVITELEKMGERDYLITCTVPGDQPLEDYEALLISQGFAAVAQETGGEMDSFLFQKDDIIIDVSSYSPGQLDLCITDDAALVCPVEDD